MLNNILVFERTNLVKTSYKSEGYRYSALEFERFADGVVAVKDAPTPPPVRPVRQRATRGGN